MGVLRGVAMGSAPGVEGCLRGVCAGGPMGVAVAECDMMAGGWLWSNKRVRIYRGEQDQVGRC